MTIRDLCLALQQEMADNGTAFIPVKVYDDREEDFLDVTGISMEEYDGVKFLSINFL